MAKLPFSIPQSLSTYVEQFEDNPEKATQKLERHLKKRGLDAVGHFLLAWFYHNRGDREMAVKNALKAKNYAPGSPLMEHLHYYLVHPESFDAWIPKEPRYSNSSITRRADEARYVLDLDALIAKLSQIESKRINANHKTTGDSSDLGQSSREVDDIVSETLANIHEKQGKLKVAIESYKKLKHKNPGRATHYDEQIERLEQMIEEAAHKPPPGTSKTESSENGQEDNS